VRDLVNRHLRTEAKKAILPDVLKQTRYLCLSMTALLLSACFPVVDKQFMALSLILGAKWIVAGRTDKINILIRQGGDDKDE